MLHTSMTRDGVTFCTHCVHPDIWDEFAPYPCDTVLALKGDSDQWDKIGEVVRYLDK